MARSKTSPFHLKTFLRKPGQGRTILDHANDEIVFGQGDPADSVFYILKGKIKLTAVSERGKEAVVAILGRNDFVGEGCLAGRTVRLTTATAITECSLVRIERQAMLRALREEPVFCDLFMTHLLSRNIRMEGDLVDQLLNSAEKRLARLLLLLAQVAKEGQSAPVIPQLTQEALAKMIGTSRERVNFLMNKFKKLGFIEYNGELLVHGSLLTVANP